MKNKKNVKLVVSEYVSNGHPDKIADQISDAILDEFLKKDKNVRTGIEVMVKDNIVVLGGEVNSQCSIDYDKVVRQVYTILAFPKNHNLSPKDIKIINLIGKQSEEIHNGVDKKDEINAGDQGFMVGYACDETSVYMPLGHYIAKKICEWVSGIPMLGPDVKSQVILEYDTVTNEAIGIHSILVSSMHQNSIEEMTSMIKEAIVDNKIGFDNNIFENFIKNNDIHIDINPCGEWRIGGPISDCGMTGRKIVVDAYGGYANVGGGACSGKDLTKVDRSGAYMCRYLAKNIVASGFCHHCKVTLSYMIGVAEPCSVEIEVDKNNDKVASLKSWIYDNLDLTPKAFINKFTTNYDRQFYTTARWGHYGVNDVDFIRDVYPWEKLDIADKISKDLL